MVKKPSDDMDISKLRPSEFMRARRPELFSDTRQYDEPLLSREMFEYALETLTSRKEEIRFEHFCRRLAEKEICPNLLPQTGPTGGGDSKVDAETYPVADAISLRWYEGIGREVAVERWAFAFSAKKDWRTKVKSDVSEIAKTKRGYRHICFITNQFVRDKTRGQLEDELSKKWKIQVHIFDRTWIVDRVFKNGHFELAIEALGLTDLGTTTRQTIGPHDAQRVAELQELESLIADPNRYQGAEYQLAEDCLQSALLARGLGRSRTEIDGRFQRAERIANKAGTRQQQLRIAYHKAWTAYWWFDDFDELNILYDRVEELALGATHSWDLELLVNLWLLLNSTVLHKERDAQAMKLEARTANLQSELARLSGDKKRPTNSLWAKMQLTIMDLTLAAREHQCLPEIIDRIEHILSEAEKLPEFPVDSLIKLVRELSQVLGEYESYDRLMELVLQLAGDRMSRSEQGRLLVDRGYQKLGTGSVYDAIRLFGRAQMLLAMKEQRGEFVRALLGTALGYEAAGLLWAARANLIVAVNQMLNEFIESGELAPLLLPLLKKLVWVELQIGRIPCVLTSIQLMWAVARGLRLDQEAWASFEEEFHLIDAVLGILLLKTKYHELRHLDAVPALMEHFNLFLSRTAVQYALGHEDAVRAETQLQEKDLLQFFTRWIEQPANDDLPSQPQWLLSDEIKLKSYVLGCEVVIRARNKLQSMLIAESILAILEAFLATSLDRRLLPYTTTLLCELSPSEYIHGPIEFRIDEDDCGEPVFKIHHAPGNITSVVKHETFRDKILELVTKLIVHISIPRNEAVLEELAAKERAFDRAFSLTELPIAVTNIFGDMPKFKLDDWGDMTGTERFSLLRSQPWYQGIEVMRPKPEKQPEPLKLGQESPPKELFGVDHLKHKDQSVFTIINKSLWDRAGWRGVLYAVPPAPSPPVFGLMFTEREAAEKIFRGWQKRVGRIDADESIHITIVSGIDCDHPSHYRVVIAQNPDLIDRGDDSKRIVIMMSRINTMTPEDSKNLDIFLKAFQQSQQYLLAPAILSATNEPDIGIGLAIQKKKIKQIPAWQIDENTPEVMALNRNDRPIIPDGVPNPPVHRALKSRMLRDTPEK